jgi:biofilm PGA synthesis lipoprotein PgaB
MQFFTVKFHKRLDYNRLQKMGIQKIIYRVFQDRNPDGGLYFSNTQFKTLQPALEQLIAGFDFKRFDLCAWMIGRKFEWISDTLLFDYRYEKGQRQQVRKLDIFNPDAVKKLIAVYKELASNRIDCILIQDDFILRYNEGFSSWGKAQFTNTAKVPAREKLMMADNTPYNLNWQRVKIDRLNKLLQLIVKNCKMVNSGIKVGINIYYETPVFVKRAEAWYSHNLEEILGTGVDYIYLMSYHRQIKDEMKLSEKRSRLLFKQIVERAFQICKEKLVVKLQLRDWETGRRIPAEEVKAYLKLVPPGVERVCFTPVKMGDFDYVEEIIKGAL